MISENQIIGYVLMLAILILFFGIGRKHGKDIVQDYKGSNKIWEAIETLILVHLILFPIMILSDVFLQLHASSYAWASMDFILFSILGFKTYTETKINKNEKD